MAKQPPKEANNIEHEDWKTTARGILELLAIIILMGSGLLASYFLIWETPLLRSPLVDRVVEYLGTFLFLIWLGPGALLLVFIMGAITEGFWPALRWLLLVIAVPIVVFATLLLISLLTS